MRPALAPVASKAGPGRVRKTFKHVIQTPDTVLVMTGAVGNVQHINKVIDQLTSTQTMVGML